MTNVGEFHDGELDNFMDDTGTEGVAGNDLLVRFREDINTENSIKSTNGSRHRIRD